MKILVISDSHGDFEKVVRIFRDGRYGAVIFLGDGLHDAQELYKISGAVPVYAVCGNCDFFSSGVPDMRLLELAGKRVLITHGHRQDVKNGTALLEAAADRMDADIALFGHTHVQYLSERDGRIFANPGSVRSGRYAVMTIEKETEIEFREII